MPKLIPAFRYRSPMPSSKDVVYSAACNPPRQAKRAKARDARPAVPVITPDETDELDEEDKEDSDYYEEPPLGALPTSTPKRRGRKPGNASRSARDSIRKQNHSRIEKARRTKINDALDTLRTLVPDEYRSASSVKEDGEDGAKKGEKEQPKEFKLEILIRTVAYVNDLIDKVKSLEEVAAAAEKVSPQPNRPLKRKRDKEDECDAGSPMVKGCGPGDVEMDQPSTSSKLSPSLPSISSWLPAAFGDHNSLFPPHTNNPLQLPSPPLSVTSRSRSDSSAVPPKLSLPSPIFTGISLSSPSYSDRSAHSPEDETAASLLLHMKTSPMIAAGHRVQTPGSVLGLDGVEVSRVR